MYIRTRKKHDIFVHSTAIVDEGVQISRNVKIWANAHIRSGAIIGENCVIGESVYIGESVVIGKNCKIQNGALIYEPCRLGDGVFIGPGAVLTNDRIPRAVNIDGRLKTKKDWQSSGVEVKNGASVGAGAICVAPLEIGTFAMIGAGSTVIKNVSDFETVVGNPARHLRYNCKCGSGLDGRPIKSVVCKHCGFHFDRN
jgi:UDP-2-acetamido-3-amino-2,3-dideoxy-glucuronate N-acetyltransferase